MRRSFQEKQADPGPTYPYMGEVYGFARIRRHARTIDGRDPYEDELYQSLDLTGNETILDAGYGDEPDDLINFRVEKDHYGKLIGMEPPRASDSDPFDDTRHIITQELISAAGIRLINGYLQDIPLEDSSVDVVMNNNSTIFVPKDQLPTAIAETERVLRMWGLATYGTNAIGHKRRQHKILHQIGKITGTTAPPPVSTNFKLEMVPRIVTRHSNLLHLPDRSIHQYTIQIISEEELPDVHINLASYRYGFDQPPSTTDFMEAMNLAPEYQRMIKQIDEIGFALDAFRRGWETFIKVPWRY